MSEHKVCKGCQYNNYPTCRGTIMPGGVEMNIENLNEDFRCGQKDMEIMTDFSIRKKSDLELRIEELETKIIELDVRKK